MRKVAFFIHNKEFANVDFRNPLKGNPGVGGSEFLIVLTAWQLSMRDNNLDVTLFAQKRGLFPETLRVFLSTGTDEAFEEASLKNFDFL